ncbi:MAG: Kdo(2)-lipid phosphoethanolamine 7-transferase [Pseudomonadota bacterium]|jgi:KDO II ethanolaminephosphotransferase
MSRPDLSSSPASPPELPAWRLWLLATLWTGGVLNLVTWRARAESLWHTLPAPWPWLGPLGEAALVLGATALLYTVLMASGRHLGRVLGALMLILTAASAYYMVRYRVVIGYGVVNAVFTTDHDLSGEVTGWWLALWMLGLGLLPAMVWWRRLSAHGLWPGARHLAWWGRVAVMALGSLALVQAGSHTLDRARLVLAGPNGADTNLVGVTAHNYLPSNWLVGSAMVAANRLRQAQDDARLKSPAKLHHYVPATALDDAVVLLVVGETTRGDRMGLLGHDRPTTPHLSANPHVAAFAGWSCDTATKLSLACMFVRPQGIEPGRDGNPDRILEDNVFGVYKHLGFSIELFAMQSEAGFYIKVKPDGFKLREVLAAQPENAGKPLDDLLLLPEVSGSLARHPAGQGPHLIVLHTKGSHAMYSQRYPRAFARWTPECMNADQFCDVAALFNAFDNSVLFVDHVLHELQQRVGQRKVLLVYSSDHGESINENQHFHATPRDIAPPEQRRVPLVFWASDSWRADPVLGARFARLQARAAQASQRPKDDTSIGHHNLFASLLGCAGIDSPDGGIPEALNLCR